MPESNSDAVVRLLKRGLNHYGLGDLESAIAAWEEARELDPENRAVRDYLETAYEETGRSSSPAEGEEAGDAWLEETSHELGGAGTGPDDETPRSLPDVELQIDDPGTGAGDTPATPRLGDAADEAAPPTEAAGAPAAERAPAPPPEPDPLENESGMTSFSGLVDPDDPDTLLQGALRAYRDGHLEEAWHVLGKAAQRDPSRLDLRAYQELIRNNLMEQWSREIGDQGRMLTLKLDLAELMQRDLAPDEGFFVAQIDGTLTIENLISLSSLDRFRTFEIISRLLREGIVE